jgi:hypothetical protein
MEHCDQYLLEEAGLPGPRGNLELARPVAEEGDAALFGRYLDFDANLAPGNSPEEFLTFCGILGLGRLLSEDQREVISRLRRCASDPRWRSREAVAIALQRWGRVDMDALLAEMVQWSQGSLLEQRAAAAALCEPALLTDAMHARATLRVLDAITGSLLSVQDHRSDAFRALRKGLGYCWSVAVVALPETGKPMMEKWFASTDSDIQWITRQNLRKKGLARMDAEWVVHWSERLAV